MIGRLLRLLQRWPTERALVASAALGLVALALMCLGVIDPRPLQVVISMSVSQLFGGLAFLGFALSIGADLVQGRQPAPKDDGGDAGTP